MKTVKSPKPCAYARLTKNKQNPINKKVQQRSAGNLYEQVLAQFGDDHQSYIKQIVSKTHLQSNQIQLQQLHEQRQIDIMPSDCTYRRKQYENSPKVSSPISNIKSDQQTVTKQKKQSAKSKRHKKLKQAQSSFLNDLNSYIKNLSGPSNQSFAQREKQSLEETVKIANRHELNKEKLATELKRSQIKQKQLQLANYYKEKQIQKRKKKENKMMRVMHDLLQEIQHLNQELTHTQKQKNQMNKLIQQLRPQNRQDRKTIGRSYLRQVNHHHWEQTKNWKARTGNIGNYQQWNELNPDRIEKMFKSGNRSETSEVTQESEV